MGTIKNMLTWSFSRDRLFKECRRAYYYQYYASWGGWDSQADESVRKAYILKNVRNIDIWVGDIVHQIIKWILQARITGTSVSCEDALKKSKILLRRTWEQSRSKAWMKNVKHNLNLFEHYYNCEPAQEELAAKLQKVTSSINNIYSSGLIKWFFSLPQENLVRIDEFDNFDFEGIKIFAIPDFVVKDNGYILYDWKTGKPADSDLTQLSCYALYAANKWGVLPEEIKIVPVYLSGEHAKLGLTKALSADEIKDYIRSSLKEMKDTLVDINENKINLDKCTKTNDSWRCRNCKYQEICQ